MQKSAKLNKDEYNKVIAYNVVLMQKIPVLQENNLKL